MSLYLHVYLHVEHKNIVKINKKFKYNIFSFWIIKENELKKNLDPITKLRIEM